MLDFKLNYYFEILKDAPFNSRKDFREKFIKKYGKFRYLEELILMVEKYQIKKYGTLLCSINYGRTKEEYKKMLNANNHRERYKKNK